MEIFCSHTADVILAPWAVDIFFWRWADKAHWINNFETFTTGSECPYSHQMPQRLQMHPLQRHLLILTLALALSLTLPVLLLLPLSQPLPLPHPVAVPNEAWNIFNLPTTKKKREKYPQDFSHIWQVQLPGLFHCVCFQLILAAVRVNADNYAIDRR